MATLGRWDALRLHRHSGNLRVRFRRIRLRILSE
jgi:hypothetical protein